MKIALDDIKATPKELAYTEGVDELNARLDRGVHDYRAARGGPERVGPPLSRGLGAQLLRGRRDRSDAPRARADHPRAAHAPAVWGVLPRSLPALRREPERRRLRLPRRAARSAPRGAAHDAREVTRGRGGRRHGRTQAPDLGEQAQQAARARRPYGAARDRLPAMW